MKRHRSKKCTFATRNYLEPLPPKMVPNNRQVPAHINIAQANANRSIMTFMGNKRANRHDQSKLYGLTKALTKTRPHSAQLNRHIVPALARSASVDSSFYDKFERVDRNSVISDTHNKRKGSGVKRAGQQHLHKTSRHSENEQRKMSARPKFAAQHKNKEYSNNLVGNYFNAWKSFDNETQFNTLSNAVRQISPRTLGIERKQVIDLNTRGRHRPRSGRKKRERSISRKRNECCVKTGATSESLISIPSSIGNYNNNNNNNRKARKKRKSCSRIRRPSSSYSNNNNSRCESTSNKNDRKNSAVSALSLVSSVKTLKRKSNEDVTRRSRSAPVTKQPEPITTFVRDRTNDKPYQLQYVINRGRKEGNCSKRFNSEHDPIRAVTKANDIFTCKEKTQKFLKCPKLKMIHASISAQRRL